MTKDYPLASTDKERERLKRQAAALVPLTERTLIGAGVASGSRVLELGCGSGEVTKLIASRIGPTGEVVALDRDAAQVAAASEQLTKAGHRNVRHIVADIESFEPPGKFDVVVGRYFLIYVANPESILRRAAEWLRPGGSLAFIEMDLFRGVRSRIWPPPTDKTNRAIEFIGHVLLDAGIHSDMAARLPSMLSYYGEVHTETAAPLQFGAESIMLPLEAVRSVQPMARKLGRHDADEFDVDALLAEEIGKRDDHTVTIPPLTIAAWVSVVRPR